MKLFEMSEYDLDRAVQAHYDRMYDDYYGTDEPDPCCENCRHYCEPVCGILEDVMTDEEAEEAEKNNDWSAIEKDKDDYCDDFDWADTEPDWEEDD